MCHLYRQRHISYKMRLFLLFLLPVLIHSTVIDPDAIWKKKQHVKAAEYLLKGFQKVKKAKLHLEEYCTPSNDLSFHRVCHEVVEDQLFPLALNDEVLILKLVLDTFYEHQNEIIAYFSKNKKLIVPKKSMDVSVMQDFQKKYNL